MENKLDTLQLDSSLHSLQLEKPHVQQQRPSAAKNSYFLKKDSL